MAMSLNVASELTRASIDAALERKLAIQAATLLNHPTTHEAIVSLPNDDARRKTLLDAASATSIASQENAYRMLNAITSFAVRDPDPHALDDGHMLGVRLDVCSGGQFKTPYYVFLRRAWPRRRTWVQLAWHTVPPGVATQVLAEKYLPPPKWSQGEDGLLIPSCCQEEIHRLGVPSEWKATAKKLKATKKAIREREASQVEREERQRTANVGGDEFTGRAVNPSNKSVPSDVGTRRGNASSSLLEQYRDAVLNGSSEHRSAAARLQEFRSQAREDDFLLDPRLPPMSSTTVEGTMPEQISGTDKSNSAGATTALAEKGTAPGKRPRGRPAAEKKGVSRDVVGSLPENHVCGPETRQDLPRFLHELRRQLISYNNRLGWVADLREAAGLVDQEEFVNGILSRETETEDRPVANERANGSAARVTDSDSDEMYGYDSADDGKRRGGIQNPADAAEADVMDESTGEMDVADESSSSDDEEFQDGSEEESEGDDEGTKESTRPRYRLRDYVKRHLRSTVSQVRIVDPSARCVQMEWRDGRVAELRMDDDGIVETLQVVQDGSRDLRTRRRLLRNRPLGQIRIEKLKKNLAHMLFNDVWDDNVRIRARYAAKVAAGRRRPLL